MESLKKLYGMIEESKVVSFDIYDTLLKRKLESPYDIFELTKLIYERSNNKLNFDFFNIRIKCESLARKKSKLEEITLEEIYNEMRLKSGVDNNILNKLKLIECELESDFIEKNDEIMQFYNYARQRNKKIIITSDMYIPQEYIENILKKENITYDKLFLSSSINKTKSKGTIYKHILGYLQCDSDEILHIGDNKQSDYINAIENGFKAYWYNNHKDIMLENIKYDRILQIVDHGIIRKLNRDDYWYNFGLKNIGILYYSFIKNMIKDITINNIDKVLFLARDGQILKEVYDFIGKEENLPKSHYFYASRRCLNVPAIYDLNEEDIEILLSNIDGKDIKYLFKKIGLTYENHINLVKKYKIEKIDKDTHRDKLKKLLMELKESILFNSSNERRTLIKYINDHELSNKKVAVVDIGWNGTLQNSLNKICKTENINTEFYGYYLGISEKTKDYENEYNIYNGFLFSNKLEKNFKIVSSFNAMFEEFFIADHGSIIKLEEKNKKIKCICEDFEYSNNEYLKLKLIQRGAIDYVKKIYELDKKYDFLEYNSNNALLRIEKVFTKPNMEDVYNLGGIRHYDYDVKYNCKPKYKLSKYIYNPKILLKDYKDSKWKIGFIKIVFKNDIVLKVFKMMKGI